VLSADLSVLGELVAAAVAEDAVCRMERIACRRPRKRRPADSLSADEWSWDTVRVL